MLSWLMHIFGEMGGGGVKTPSSPGEGPVPLVSKLITRTREEEKGAATDAGRNWNSVSSRAVLRENARDVDRAGRSHDIQEGAETNR